MVDLDYLFGKKLYKESLSLVGDTSLVGPFASDTLYVGWYGREHRDLWQVDFAGRDRPLGVECAEFTGFGFIVDEHTLAGRVLLDYQYFGDLESLYGYVNSRQSKMYKSTGFTYTFALREFAKVVGVSVGFIEELVSFGLLGYVAFVSVDGYSKGEPLFGLEHLVQFRKRLGVRLPLVVKV